MPADALSRLKHVIADAAPERLAQAELHQFIDALQLQLADLHVSITSNYFSVETVVQPETKTAAA